MGFMEGFWRKRDQAAERQSPGDTKPSRYEIEQEAKRLARQGRHKESNELLAAIGKDEA